MANPNVGNPSVAQPQPLKSFDPTHFCQSRICNSRSVQIQRFQMPALEKFLHARVVDVAVVQQKCSQLWQLGHALEILGRHVPISQVHSDDLPCRVGKAPYENSTRTRFLREPTTQLTDMLLHALVDLVVTNRSADEEGDH